MIQQEIKIHDEPVFSAPVKYNNQYWSDNDGFYNHNKVTQLELEAEVEEAKRLNFKIGDKYKYKTTNNLIEIIAWETDTEKANIFGTRIGSMRCRRSYDGSIYNYSIDEFMGTHMEKAS